MTTEQYNKIFDLLPFKGKTDKLIKYDYLVFKNAPKWAQVAPYTKALQHLLECSGGVNVNQKSFYKAALGQNELWGFDAEELEKGWRA